MERWASNTLRTLGIILTAGFVIIVSLALALLSMCASSGGYGGNKRPDEALQYAAAAILVAVAGIAVIVWLARGIYRSSKDGNDGYWPTPPTDYSASPALPSPESLPPQLHLSPPGRRSIHRLAFALAAQIVFSLIALIFNQLHFWSNQRGIFAPFPYHNWLVFLLAPFILYHIPYAILIYTLLKRPDRRAFAYSLAVPAVLIMQSLLSLGFFGLFSRQHPIAILLLVVPWLLHIVILAFAYQAIQQVGLHPPPSSLIVAALVTFVFFSFAHVLTPILYRFLG
jgi:hypothetical protein